MAIDWNEHKSNIEDRIEELGEKIVQLRGTAQASKVDQYSKELEGLHRELDRIEKAQGQDAFEITSEGIT